MLFIGTQGNDIIFGSEFNDRILGLAGNDFLIGNNGNDLIEGGIGNDTINGGIGGRDTITGGPGNDVLEGSSQLAIGGPGGPTFLYPNTIDGGTGDDTIYSIFSGERIRAGEGNDSILMDTVGVNNTNVIAGDGNDAILFGGRDGKTAVATVWGGEGNDSITFFKNLEINASVISGVESVTLEAPLSLSNPNAAILTIDPPSSGVGRVALNLVGGGIFTPLGNGHFSYGGQLIDTNTPVLISLRN